MTKTWIQNRKKDQYYRLARIRGYRSRAAYKLLQTIRTYKLVRPGDKVVDLGSQPGGWLQVARESVGPDGLVLGIDIKPIEPLPYENLKILTMDIYTPDIADTILRELEGPADALVSDLAPTIIGAWDVDHARQVDLARKALEIAEKVLRHNGNVLIKLFHGPELKNLEKDASQLFRASRLLKPKASRPESSEVYFLGLRFKPHWNPIIQTNTKNRPVLLTGLPGVGKTTLIKKLVEHYRDQGLKVAGITTEEVRDRNWRTGFKITDVLTNQEGWLAQKQPGPGPRIGAYTVSTRDLDAVGTKALETAAQVEADMVVIDEIGPMEMTSPSFRVALAKVIATKTPLIASVRHGSNYPELYPIQEEALRIEITNDNRDSLFDKLIEHLDPSLKKNRAE
ncbi:MAG TPA: NTPase [Candidatus Bathyarchaeia archaeon]|nr:NTPase [Candidatus Bathyarchaeia archaeon]